MGTRINESLIKYLAGLLDADGSLSLTFRSDPYGKPIYYVGLALKLTASDEVDRHGFVEGLPQMTGMGSSSRYGAQRQFVQWTVNGRADLEMLLPRLIKHMVIKAKHWQWLLDEWRKGRAGERIGWTCDAAGRDALTEASKHSRRTNVGPIKPKNHPTWAWVAGFLDGDGSYINLPGRTEYASRVTGEAKQYAYRIMRVSAVAHVHDASVLDFLQKAFGGTIGGHSQTQNLRVWVRAMGGDNRSFALRFLPKVARHSRLKRHKIDQMIHYHQQRLSVSGATAQAIV